MLFSLGMCCSIVASSRWQTLGPPPAHDMHCCSISMTNLLSSYPCSDVSDSEAADTVPPLRLLYSGRRRSLNFCRVAYHAPEQQGNAAGNENAASDKNDASDSHHSTADSGGGGGEIGGSEDSRRAGLVLNTKLDPEHVCKAGSEQRSPLRAFLRRHVQWGGR